MQIIIVEPHDSPEPAELLARAIRRGDVGRVADLLLQQQRAPALPLGFGLLEAAARGHRDILEMMLEAAGQGLPQLLEAPVDARGRSALHFAAAAGDYAGASMLLARCASVDATTREGFTPCAYAAAEGHRGVMELLLEAGAALNHRAADGSTPLLLAAEEGHFLCVQSLLRRGANPDLPDSEGTTALLAALAGGHRRAAEALLAAGAQTGGRTGGRSALHWAAHHGFASVLRSLLEQGGAADMDAEDEAGETALLLAARRGHEAAVQELCQHGAVVDKANRSGVTPLAAAALFGHAGAVGALLARGAGTGVCDLAHKRSPLHFAAMADAADVARLLLQHGANPTIVDATNATPCDLAVEYECTLVVQLLSSSR